MKPVLSVRDLTKVFTRQGQADLTAVDRLSFDLMKGECLGIIGESGSGKSTVAAMITRLTDVTSGTILLDGEDVTRVRGVRLRDLYKKIQMVFQQPEGSFDPRRRIGDGIAESLINRGKSRREAAEQAKAAMQACGLDPALYDRFPHQLSGGQCQRAAIARALIGHPKVLICDEATSALDVTIQKEIMDLLAGLLEAGGLSCIFICHDIALVEQLCDRVIVMYQGRSVEEGSPDEVISHPRNAYTKQLIEGRNLKCLK